MRTFSKQKSCYKVITADKNDDIVDIQASLIVGVAREICAQEQRKTSWLGNLGILSPEECNLFTAALKNILGIEESLFLTIQ